MPQEMKYAHYGSSFVTVWTKYLYLKFACMFENEWDRAYFFYIVCVWLFKMKHGMLRLEGFFFSFFFNEAFSLG